MKFDAARVAGIIEELADPRYEGQEGEAKVADFIAQRFSQMGMVVERREVIGARSPLRFAPWVGWLVYATMMTATYAASLPKNSLVRLLMIPILVVGTWWLSGLVRNPIGGSGRRPRGDAAPLVIASAASKSNPPRRVVLQAVLGGLEIDIFRASRLVLRRVMLVLHAGFAIFSLMTFAARTGSDVWGKRLLEIDLVFLMMIWIAVACFLRWEWRRSRTLIESRPDPRGLATLLELARCWPRTRSDLVEAVFVAGGGRCLDYAGARECVRVLRSGRSTKPSLFVLILAPGPANELRVYEHNSDPSAMKGLVDDVATSLWIPVRRADAEAISSVWSIISAWSEQSIAIIGSDPDASSGASVDPQVLHRTIQLASEVALRWAKDQPRRADS